MESELTRRAEDLWQRCRRISAVTNTNILTPAEQQELRLWAGRIPDSNMILRGGYPGAERCAAFFLPDYMTELDFVPEDYFRCVKVSAGFGTPGHRDYMGSVLGLGIKREWLGDILVEGSEAHIICLPSVADHILASLEKVGRCGVKTAEVALTAIPLPRRETKELRFSVQSLRLDAVTAGMFRLSRTQAAQAINQGLVSLNYLECLKSDAPVREGDIISLRGKGKGSVADTGGRSKKDRIFVTAEVLK